MATGSSSTTSTQKLFVELPALSTIFTPSPSCTENIYYVVDPDVACVEENGSGIACRQMHLGPTTSTSDCFPTSWGSSSGAFVSPGDCPVGYTVACAYTTEVEKTATCCPSGFSCQLQSEGFPWYTTDLCVQSMADTVVYWYTTRTPGKDPETSTTTGGGALNAFGVDVRWQMSDLSTPTSTSAAVTSVVPTSGETIIAPPPVEISQIVNAASLSTGARAGIGVGVAAASIIALLGAFVVWRRWRRRKQQGAVELYAPQVPEGFQLTKVGSELVDSNNKAWSQSAAPSYYHTERSELPGESLPAELASERG
ncbi:hypothetical protein F4804DRAFT_317709 [Jackrogersella minutella]|nr:hypothetical protein F4804DRAFT_317709 [Jackrogersella minutella]